jgi:hypothetical protein
VNSQAAARARGRELADDLWDDNNFSCRNIESYIRAAKRLDRKCKAEFKRNDKFIRACKAGVREVVDRKKEPCVFDDEECKRLGKSLGSGIADIICKVPKRSFKGRRPTFSRKCIRTSTNTCKKAASNKIEKLLDNGECGDNEFYTNRMKKEVKKKCREEVKKYARGT